MVDYNAVLVPWSASIWEADPTTDEQPEQLTLEEFKEELGLPNTELV